MVQLTLEDRLIATGQLDGPSQSESSSVRPPRADQLVVQLTQGLQSDDHCMLNVSCLFLSLIGWLTNDVVC